MSFWESLLGAYLGTVLGSLTLGLISFFLIKFLIKRLSQDPEVIKLFRAAKKKILDEDGD